MIYFGNINPTKITIVNYLLNYAHKYFLFMKSYYYAKMGYLVILDRYAYNNTLDYYNNQPKLKKVINKIIYYYLFPKPDLFILLETKPEIYFKRKKEHNIKKLTNMLNSYKKILQNTKHVIINTTNNNPEEVIKLIKPTIFRKHLKGINSKK